MICDHQIFSTMSIFLLFVNTLSIMNWIVHLFHYD